VGCGVVIATDGTRITGVSGDPDHPANLGRLCSKGSTLHLTTGLTGRALHPELRMRRNAPRARVTWGAALAHAANQFASIIRAHGPDAVAFYISGQLLTEDYYVFNKLAKGLIGTNNIDTNSRLCMSSAVAGYKATLGADAPPACYEDVDHAQALFIAGSNTAWAHPVLYRRIEAARLNNPKLKTIVVDPRRTETAREADLHLPILPGSDVALYNAMLHVMLQENWVDHGFIASHSEGYDALKDTVRDYTPAFAADVCGVPAADIVTAAKWFATSGATLSLYCQGLNQSSHGTHNNAALINLHLATAQIGKPGAGPFSLTGQPNAMGGREVGGLANLISAHRDMANPVHRAEVAALWGVPAVPASPGKTAVELFDALHAGTVKAVWIACTNPAQSMPDVTRVHTALEKAEFVVVQDAFANTETAAYADLLLPASTWGEKDGTVTNSERRISRVRRAVAAPGEVRADWEIARDFALVLGANLGNADAPRLFDYPAPESVFNEHRSSTRGRDLDITGLSYGLLETQGPQQWPFPEGATSGKARLYADGQFPTPSGRARFVNTVHQPVAEKTDARFPLHFNTGRLRDQWHGMSRSGRVARLANHTAEALLEMNPRDLALRRLNTGDIVRVWSRRGALTARVAPNDDLRSGHTYMPMHWGARSLNSAGVNALTVPAFDPFSKQPELKHAAVEVARMELPFRVVAMRRFEMAGHDAALTLLDAARPLLTAFDHAQIGLAGRDGALVVLRGFHAMPVADEVLDRVDTLFGTNSTNVMRYVDARKRIEKRACVDQGVVTAVCLAGETAAQEWLKNMMIEGASAEAVRPWILAPVANAPRGSLNRGRIVCACHNVSETEIRAEAGAGLGGVQAKLKCGTDCGSCLPAVKQLITEFAKAAA
jgi:assimilatory nitrate reductase catalytic subunit